MLSLLRLIQALLNCGDFPWFHNAYELYSCTAHSPITPLPIERTGFGAAEPQHSKLCSYSRHGKRICLFRQPVFLETMGWVVEHGLPVSPQILYSQESLHSYITSEHGFSNTHTPELWRMWPGKDHSITPLSFKGVTESSNSSFALIHAL